MKKLTQILFLIIIPLNLLFAQDVDGNRVKESIRDLARKIEQIRSLAERYQNEAALKVIAQAEEDLAQAIALLKEWENDNRRINRLILARAKYQAANRKADYASRLVLYKPIANLKNDLERLMQQAENAALQIDNNDLIYFLTKAREFHRKAIQSFEQNRYLKGYEYVRIATYFANKTISFLKANRSEEGMSSETFNQQRTNIQNLLNQAAMLKEHDAVLNDLYENAQDYLEQSSAAYNRGNYKRAFALLQLTERLLYRLIDLADNSADGSRQNQVENNYQSLGRYLNAVRNEYEQSGQESRLLNKAENLYRKAGRFLQNGDLDQAVSTMNLSQTIAMHAFKKLSAADDTNENINIRLREIERLITLQNNRLTNVPDASLKSLHNQAVELFNASRQAAEQGKGSRAVYLLNVSLRLLNKVERLINNPDKLQIDAQQIQNDLSRLQNIITRLKDNPEINSTNYTKIEIIENLVTRAQNEFQQNNLLSAAGIVELVQKQLSTLINN